MPLMVIIGNQRKAQELVTEWLEQHKDELLEMWDKQIITKLPPL